MHVEVVRSGSALGNDRAALLSHGWQRPALAREEKGRRRNGRFSGRIASVPADVHVLASLRFMLQLPFSHVASLNGVHLFSKSHQVTLRATVTQDATLFWKDYFDRYVTDGIFGLPEENGIPAGFSRSDRRFTIALLQRDPYCGGISCQLSDLGKIFGYGV